MTFRWQRRVAGRLTAHLRRLVQEALKSLGQAGAEVGILFCDDATIRTLNRRFRGKDTPTDVLSFPIRSHPQEGAPYFGDIAISVETAARQAGHAGVRTQEELEVLLLHGLVHLAGFDHETDGGEMAALESRLRQDLIR